MSRWVLVVALIALAACRADKAEQERARESDVVLTSGDPIDCTGDLTEATRQICADVDLRNMDRQIAELWTQVEPVTGRPNTLRFRHTAWLAERDAGERDWDRGGFRTRTPSELREFQQAYIDELSEELRQARALPATSPITALAGGCIGTALNGCAAPSSGYVTAPSGQRLAWQIQQGSTDYAGVSAGVILFAIDGSRLRPIGWSFEAGSFQPPTMFQNGEALYVAAKGTQVGTGSANADLLFRLDGDHWTEIEIEGWKTALAEALPDGLGVWKGVDYDWPDFLATSSLWRDEDANCCPTGGEVLMNLAVQGTSLRLAGVQVQATDR